MASTSQGCIPYSGSFMCLLLNQVEFIIGISFVTNEEVEDQQI